MAFYRITPPDRPAYIIEQEQEPAGLPPGYTWLEMDSAALAAETRSAARTEQRDALARVLSAKFAQGFEVSGTGTDLDGQRLEVRDGTNDRTNWLTSEGEYAQRVAEGLGSYEGAQFKTASNERFTVSFDTGLAVLRAMRLWGFAMMQRSWDLKDEIDAAADPKTIDLQADWP